MATTEIVDRVLIFEDHAGRFQWRAYSQGRIVDSSKEGWSSAQYLVDHAYHSFPGAEVEIKEEMSFD